MPLWSRSKPPKSKNPDPPDQALSPDEVLFKISAEIRPVLELENLGEREISALDLVSCLTNAYRSLNTEKKALDQEKVRLEGMIKVNQVNAQNQIDNLRDARDLQAQRRKECEERIEAMKITHAKSMADLKARQEEKEGRMREEYKFDVQNLEDKIQSHKKRAEEREKDFILEKAQLEKGHKIKRDELKEQFEVHESKLKQEHDQQRELLRRSIQSRNRALIARENFSPITDGELKSMFSDLVRKVDALARLKWTLNRSPWTDELQSRMSDTPKRLQKQILQDTIWNVLFQNVFCSPFRVFGEEGRVLESQWNKVFGKDPKTDNGEYTWPEPSFDAERWRYETMRQCQEVLRISTSEYDPRTRLRKGFQSSMKIIREKLGEQLEMVSKIDERTEKATEEIREEAAKMWVAFGTQRCRLLVVIQDLKTTEEVKSGPGKQGNSVELITQPELRRVGDAEGQALDKEQTVTGCEGEIKILYSRQ